MGGLVGAAGVGMMIPLGAKVRAPGRIFRQRQGSIRKWYKPTWRQKPIEGIYIGVRTYANGIAEWYDYGTEFTANEHIKVALIVQSTRTKPIPVMYDDVELI